MKLIIVITTINKPTESIKKISQQKDAQLIVIGDKKTPMEWYSHNVAYYSLVSQSKFDNYGLTKFLPINHYSRKMLGYLIAMSLGAELIVDTDDDNIPYESIKVPNFQGKFNVLKTDAPFFNIYNLFTNEFIWPRGLPLRFVKIIEKYEMDLKYKHVGVWQGLADDEPDVDAVYRLIINKQIKFHNHEPVVIDRDIVVPFNSQNTGFLKATFILMYLPITVTFRFTDILRSLVAQPIMWLYDFNLGYFNATVYQNRNVHDLMNDFESEIPMYLHTEKVVDLVKETINPKLKIDENLRNAYIRLSEEGIVEKNEIKSLNAWIQDVNMILNTDNSNTF